MKEIGKLPAITISFWIIKICATTLDETVRDLLSMTLKIGYAISSVILLFFFLEPWLYSFLPKNIIPLSIGLLFFPLALPVLQCLTIWTGPWI